MVTSAIKKEEGHEIESDDGNLILMCNPCKPF